jgi:UDP-N-acetylmuramate dehydrogenase
MTGQTTELVSERLSASQGLSVGLAEPLARFTTFRIGGPAEILVRVETPSALQHLMSVIEELSVPVQILGQGSNILIPDSGVGGVVLTLEGSFKDFRFEGERLAAGAGVALARLAKIAAERDLVGLEALAGFPSTLGGAVVMNAGCYGVEIIELIESVSVVEFGGSLRQLKPQDLGAEYRSTNLLGGQSIVCGATLALRRGDGKAALERMAEINRKRRASLPSGHPNAGSTFKNPEGDFAGRLIEACGLKGERSGGAQISDHHANVIVNLGNASADDVLKLMLVAHRQVKFRFDVLLEPELILVGELKDRWKAGIGKG